MKQRNVCLTCFLTIQPKYHFTKQVFTLFPQSVQQSLTTCLHFPFFNQKQYPNNNYDTFFQDIHQTLNENIIQTVTYRPQLHIRFRQATWDR